MGGRGKKHYRRRSPRIEPEPALLVVTEGEKTEPLYFEALRGKLHLVATRIEIQKADGTDPKSVVAYAISQRAQRRREAKKGEGVEYEAVWVVFDSEQKLGTQELNDALQLAGNEGILVAMSAPCFEYWFILHYEYTTQYMCSYQEAADRLKRHVLGYVKNDPPVDELLTRVATAVHNAEKCRRAQDAADADLPRTDVDLLVVTMNCSARKHHRLIGCPDNAD